MKIYIAASWKHQHAVEMLTHILRMVGHEVLSFVENNFGEGYSHDKQMPFEEWMKTPSADRCFAFDTTGAGTSDIVIYLGPSGRDASVELGIAWANNIPILGLYAKGEDLGLMRKCITWFDHYDQLIDHIQEMSPRLVAIFK